MIDSQRVTWTAFAIPAIFSFEKRCFLCLVDETFLTYHISMMVTSFRYEQTHKKLLYRIGKFPSFVLLITIDGPEVDRYEEKRWKDAKAGR